MHEKVWALIGAFALCGSFCACCAVFARSLPRNHVMGLRSRHTMSSDAAWRAGHVAAAPWTGAAAAVCFLGVLAAWATAALTGSEQLVDGVGLVVMVLLVGCLLTALSVASAAARDACTAELSADSANR